MTITVDSIIYNIFVFVFVIVISVLLTKLIGKFNKEEIVEEETSLEDQLEKSKK